MSNLKENRKILNLCVQCGTLLDREGICCIRCNDMNNVSKRHRREKLIINSLCIECSKPLDREGVYCKACAKKYKHIARVMNAERRRLGLCVRCANPSEGYYYCQRCRDIKNDRYNKKK